MSLLKPARMESKALRDAARGRDCTLRLPGCTGGGETTVLAHFRGKWALGVSTKPHDTFGGWACDNCHRREEANLGCTDHDRLRSLYETQSILLREGLLTMKGCKR